MSNKQHLLALKFSLPVANKDKKYTRSGYGDMDELLNPCICHDNIVFRIVRLFRSFVLQFWSKFRGGRATLETNTILHRFLSWLTM